MGTATSARTADTVRATDAARTADAVWTAGSAQAKDEFFAPPARSPGPGARRAAAAIAVDIYPNKVLGILILVTFAVVIALLILGAVL